LQNLDNLSAREIHKLQMEHDKRHGYYTAKDTYETRINWQGVFVDPNEKYAREYVLHNYNQRTDVWEEWIKETEQTLHDELIEFDVPLIECPQGYMTLKNGKKRKRPSKWLFHPDHEPMKVEHAVAEKYIAEGYNVSHSFSICSVLLKAYCYAYFSPTDDTWLWSDNPERVENINDVEIDLLSEGISHVIDDNIKAHQDFETDTSNKLLNKQRVKNLRAMDPVLLTKQMEVEYCSQIIHGISNRKQLAHKILEAHQLLPKSLLPDFWVHCIVYGVSAGSTDLFLWKENETRFVEVKSPRDKVHLNQAKFYKFYMRKNGFKYEVARVVPT